MEGKPWKDNPRTVQECLRNMLEYADKEDEKDATAIQGVVVIFKMSEARLAASLHNHESYEDNPLLFQKIGVTDADLFCLTERVKYNLLVGGREEKEEPEE